MPEIRLSYGEAKTPRIVHALPSALTLFAFGIASHAHHCRTQQPLSQFVPALQLVDDVIVLGLVGVDHLDRLMQIGIERFAFSGNGLHSQLGQRIVKLLVDELDAIVKILQRRGIGLQGAIQAVEDRQQRLQCIRQSVVAIVLLLLGVALAKVIELGLQTRRTIQKSRAFGASLLQFGL